MHLNQTRPVASKTIFSSFFLKNLAYYGMISLLASFLIKGLKYSESYSINLISQYLVVVNIFIFAGAFMADTYLGIRRSYLLGHIFYFLALSFLAFISLSIDLEFPFQNILVIWMFVFLSLAGTTMNSTSHTLLTKSHQLEGKLELLNNSYSYHYLSGTFGAILGKILFPLCISTSLGVIFGYQLAFSISTGVVFLAVLNILYHYKELTVDSVVKVRDNKNTILLIGYFIGLILMNFLAFGLQSIYLKFFAIILFSLAILYFLVLAHRSQKSEKIGIYLAVIVCLQMMIFFIYRNQVFTSLAIYPLHTMQPFHIFGLTIGGEIALAFNAFWGILGVPLALGLLGLLRKRGKNLYIGYQFIIGMLLTSISYGIFWYSTVYALQIGVEKISIGWFFVGHAFVAIAEVFIMNLALASLSLLVPKNLIARIIGLHYMAMGIGAIIAGELASNVALGLNPTSIEIYTVYQSFFASLTLIAVIFTLIFIATTIIMKYLEQHRYNS